MALHRKIQFMPSEKPERDGPLRDKEDPSCYDPPITGPSRKLFLVPQVISEMEKKIRRNENEADQKHVDIDEHLMSPQDVAIKYNTKIDMEKPGKSAGLTKSQVEQLLLEHGPNVLTSQKKTNPFIKYLGYLSSLFNLLLILAGVVEYILLGISFKRNFQNVSCLSLANQL
jgi:sodium/potassium-transporting ATPase subunit alpha